MSSRFTLNTWRSFLALFILTGLTAMAILLRLPSEGGPGAFGLSARRLVVLSGMALPAIGAGLLLGLLSRPAWIKRWEQLTNARLFLPIVICLAATLLILPPILLEWLDLLYHGSEEFFFRAIADRLTPLGIWLGVTGALLAGTLFLAHRREIASRLENQAASLRLWGWIGMGLAALAALVRATGIGLHAIDPLGSFGTPTVPLLEWQIALAALATWLTWQFVLRRAISPRTDTLLTIAVWAIAAALWAAQPLVPGYFATPGRAPNFEIYPFSDGATYDQQAQSILIGNGFIGNTIPARALYLVFLAGLHLLAGQSYPAVILAQTLVLALLPAVIYRLGVELHSRPAGLLTALLMILRELTAIRAAPFTDNISYSKLYFSEMPTALCLAALTLFLLRWLKHPRQALIPALLAGGFLGMAMLIRTQSLAVLPLALLAGGFAHRRRLRVLLPGAALLAAGLIVTVIPWLAYNYPLVGGIAFDNPDSQTLLLAQRYNGLSLDSSIPREPGESEVQYSARLLRMGLAGIARDPVSAAWLVGNHFANSEINNLLLLPIRFQMRAPSELLWPTSAFWQSWSGELTPAQGLLVIVGLAMLAAGFAGLHMRLQALGWIPLLVNLSYNFGTAFFRSSGGRFLLPVDWTFLLLISIGLAQIGLWLQKLSQMSTLPSQPADRSFTPFPHRSPVWRIGLGLAIFLLVGATLPLSQVIFPKRYPAETRTQQAAELLAVLPPGGENAQADAVRDFLTSPKSLLVRGRALYPRFYTSEESEPKTAKTGYSGMNFARLVFFVIGSSDSLAVLPIDEAPTAFPHASDVLLVACQRTNYIQVMAVVENGRIHLSNLAVPFLCDQ